MRRLAKQLKTPTERKRYIISWDEWLDEGEEIVDVDFTITPSSGDPIEVDTATISDDGRSASFFVSSGDDGVTYEMVVNADTDGGQTKECLVVFKVDVA